MAATEFGGSVKVHRIEWTSSAGGAATQAVHIDGEILRVVTVPGAGGLAPDADYDITFVDEDSFDIMAGGLADRHTSNSEAVVPAARVVHYGVVTVTIANAGNANAGVVKVYVR
jgi:hypothetical protein